MCPHEFHVALCGIKVMYTARSLSLYTVTKRADLPPFIVTNAKITFCEEAIN